MSKGNLFLGMGRGKVGDVVFSRQNGEQVTRVRNRSPRNPQSPLQLLQRVVLKTCASAYSLMQDITDHSFQGLQEGTRNQSRFMALNVQKLRTLLADEINSGEAEDIFTSSKTNFSRKGNNLAELNSYIISEGTIARLPYRLFSSGSDTALVLSSIATTVGMDATYQQVVDALGLQIGDQLTFLVFAADDSEAAGLNGRDGKFVAMSYARVILEPANGDMTEKFLTLPTGETFPVINQPNEKNDGDLIFQFSTGTPVGGSGQTSLLLFDDINITDAGRGTGLIPAGKAVIASRYNGGVWERSGAEILVPTAAAAHAYDWDVDTLGDAIQSYLSSTNSSLYLNQSE